MGSRPLSAGRTSESTETEEGDRNDNAPTRPARVRQLGATNTNAREHSQPDRLKLLFRDQRGYRTLSEQKVSEWLSKNNQFYTTMPKDLTEIPENIYSPLQDPEELQNEVASTQINRSERSGHNATLQCHISDSYAVYQIKRKKYKMNHYIPKSGGHRQQINNGPLVIHKAEVVHRKLSRSLGRMNRGDKRNDDSDVHRIDGSTSAASSSSQLTSKKREPLAKKRYQLTNSGRDSHSMALHSYKTARWHLEKWPPNNPISDNRKTLPSMLQNNATIKQRLRQTDSCIEPGKTMHRTSSSKRSRSIRRQGLCALPSRGEVYRKPELRPTGKDCSTQDSRSQLTKVHTPISCSSAWQSPANMNRLRKIAAMWMGGETKPP